ncbi:MAG: serine/threonine-protein kinase [Myxococcota bacterium]
MAQAPRLAPGSIFARDYKVVDLLAEGGMGAVYRAEQMSTRKLRALKLISTRLDTDPKGRERFVREATVGASIDSEHAVEVIGAGVDETTGRPWLAMEMLDGADLGAVVDYQGPISPGQLREVVGQLCHGLAAAHRAGVVHRDLKPANIFVARSRRAGVPFTIKILDFGIAKVVQESGSGATETDTVGSPLWMAPEQLNAQRPTPATDVWALGLLGFWALTGLHYWMAAHAESSTVQALFVEQLFKPLVPASTRATELGFTHALPPGFDDWFSRCTQRDAPRRFPDAQAASDALLALLTPDPEAAAQLLPNVALAPSIGVTEPEAHTGSESTQPTQPNAWGASSVVSAAELAAARSSFEGEATRTDPPGLGADLSRDPLSLGPSVPAARSRISPLVVMLSVALVMGVMVGAGYLAWQWQAEQSSSADSTMNVIVPSSSDEGGDDDPHYPAGGDQTGSAATGAVADTGSGHAVDPGPAEPLLQIVIPHRTQLDRKVHEVRFLGWSGSGHRFALQAEYRSDRDGKHNRLVLIEIRDALTGSMVESFLVSRDAAKGTSRYHALSKAAAEARPHADWPARREALAIDKRAPTLKAPEGGGHLILEAEDAPEGTSTSFPPSELGVAYRWTSVSDPLDDAPDPSAPAMTVSYVHESSRWPLLSLAPPFTQRQLAERRILEDEDPALAGHVLAFWSPDGSRVILVHEAELRPAGEPPLNHHRWVLRAAGPQIRLVEAGAGQQRIRQFAATLAATGRPVASVELRAPPEATSSLLYTSKRDGTRQLANEIRALMPERLPEPTGKRARKRDLTAVVVVLGHDAG